MHFQHMSKLPGTLSPHFEHFQSGSGMPASPSLLPSKSPARDEFPIGDGLFALAGFACALGAGFASVLSLDRGGSSGR
ncbi:MAG TPA: hypothetical protein VHX65_05790 [Pirellulales bacterium]|nr:hypothetical protein [Pirellulales bacterium]